MTSNVSSITVSVPSGDGYEQPAETGVRGRIAEKMRRLPKVDANGRTVATQAETGVTQVTDGSTPGKPPSMVTALIAAAAACGADPQALADSESFTASIGAISPADSAGLQGAVLDAMRVNPSLAIQPPRQGMQSNPAQGSSAGGGTVPSRPQTTLERIHSETAKVMDQPLPPGSTTY